MPDKDPIVILDSVRTRQLETTFPGGLNLVRLGQEMDGLLGRKSQKLAFMLKSPAWDGEESEKAERAQWLLQIMEREGGWEVVAVPITAISKALSIDYREPSSGANLSAMVGGMVAENMYDRDVYVVSDEPCLLEFMSMAREQGNTKELGVVFPLRLASCPIPDNLVSIDIGRRDVASRLTRRKTSRR